MNAVVQESLRLSAGRHLHPDDGMCLMEYVSTLDGRGFTDAPVCTDPLVAELARLVNDNIGEHARSSLTSLAPRLVGLPGMGRAGDARTVGAALDVVLCHHPGRSDLLRHRRRAMRRAAIETPRRGLLEHLRSGLYRRGPARHALSCAVYVATTRARTPAHRDTVLKAMLEEAVAAVPMAG